MASVPMGGPLDHHVLIFDRRGIYPEGTFRVPNGVFHADPEIVFSAVYGQSWIDLRQDVHYSEFDWASPHEVRLLAALMFCERRGDRRMCFYPLRYGFRVGVERPDFSNEEMARLKRAVLEKAPASRDASGMLRDAGRPYDLESPQTFALDRFPMFWQRLEGLDFLTMRAAMSLIKADMLTCHREFYEEGVMSCYIALEASFRIVLRTLAAQGIRDPTSRDAAKWVHTTFNEAFGLPEPSPTARYFEAYYVERVMTLHPLSQYGEVPFAPTMHDDYIFLRRDLRELLAYLVAGEHGDDYHADVRRERRFATPAD